MTGDQFRECIDRLGLSRRALGDRWGVSHVTIINECHKNEVRELYRSAVLWTLHEMGKKLPEYAAQTPEKRG